MVMQVMAAHLADREAWHCAASQDSPVSCIVYFQQRAKPVADEIECLPKAPVSLRSRRDMRLGIPGTNSPEPALELPQL